MQAKQGSSTRRSLIMTYKPRSPAMAVVDTFSAMPWLAAYQQMRADADRASLYGHITDGYSIEEAERMHHAYRDMFPSAVFVPYDRYVEMELLAAAEVWEKEAALREARLTTSKRRIGL
jgi:hypothetical protein